jgi:DNA processing protein
VNPIFFKDTLKLKDQTIEFLQSKVYLSYLQKVDIWINKNKNNCIVSFFDDKYPESLKHIPTPPLALYCIGDISLLQSTQISIVGSRKNTAYGKNATSNIVAELVANNITITSGLAYGIDTLAHKYTLDNNGKTIAVIGTGIDIIYPATNKALAQNIAINGLIISEFPFGTGPQRHNFPQRNRVISALAKGVLVIEATQKSGSLITAKYALEQNKEVFAIPGSIFSEASLGCNELIKQGAKLVSNIDDILSELNIEKQIKQNTSEEQDLLELEQIIYNLLDYQSIKTIDSIINHTKLSYTETNEILFELEMKGIAESVVGGYIKK